MIIGKKTLVTNNFWSCKLACLVSLLLLLQSCAATKAQPVKTYNLVTDFGAVGDNRTNNYAAFQHAAATLSGKRNILLQIPQGQYYIADYKVEGGPKKNNISDVIFRNITGFRIEGNNSLVRVNGNFKRSADYKNSGVSFDYAYNNTVSPFTFTNCNQTSLNDITVEGGVQQMTKDPHVVEGFCYGVMIQDIKPGDVSSNVSFNNIHVNYFATDGLFIRSSGKNIRVNNSSFMHNARQGCSIVKGKDITINRSVFDSTGYTGKYGSHSPAAGVDIENEYSIADLTGVKISNSVFRHNFGFQFVSTAASGTVMLDSCFFRDNTGGYSNGFNGVGIYSYNSGMTNSILFGMIQLETAHETYQGTQPLLYKNNIIYSGQSAILSSDFNSKADITDNLLLMLPNAVPGQFFPHIRNSNANFTRNLIVLHADKMLTHKNQFTGLVQNVKNANDNFWFINNNKSATAKAVKQTKDFYFVSYDGVKNLGNQFFPENEKIASARDPKSKMLSINKTDELLGSSLFREFNQQSYNATFLAQADLIRKSMAMIAGPLK
ncbi:MAG: hypothetical protein JWQ27_812 [Ferruginibacter sp.]|nr:hypothetical protein [Ferruginibacter sp.]